MGRHWGDLIAAMIAAGIATLVISRICLWLASSLGDTRRKIVVAHVVTLMVAVTSASFALGVDGAPNLLWGAVACLPTQLLWLVWDLSTMRQRRLAAEPQTHPGESRDPISEGPRD